MMNTMITEDGNELNLTPAVLRLAHWRNLPPLIYPPARDFNRTECLKKLRNTMKGYNNCNWSAYNLGLHLSEEEAEFWLLAAARYCSGTKILDIEAQLTKFEARGNWTVEKIRQEFATRQFELPMELAPVLAKLIGPAATLAAITKGLFHPANPNTHWTVRYDLPLYQGFWLYVLPYVSRKIIEPVETLLDGKLDPSLFPKNYHDEMPRAFYTAAILGMHEPLQELVSRWVFPPNDPQRHVLFNMNPQLILAGLADPILIQQNFRLYKWGILGRFGLRSWFSHTGVNGLGFALENVKGTSHEMIAVEELARLQHPAVAAHMLQLKLGSSQPAVARDWLEKNPQFAIPGLLPIAAGRGKTAEAALHYLHDADKLGHREKIQKAFVELGDADSTTRARIERLVLNRVERAYTPFDAQNSLNWFPKITLTSLAKRSIPEWLQIGTLPPIVVGEHCLNHHQVQAVLDDLQMLVLQKNSNSQYDLSHISPLVDHLKQVAEPHSCDLFVRAIFERWLAEKRSAQDYWVMGAVAKFGGDLSIAALLPRMRRWPGGASTKRIREAMYVLRLIGSPYALGQLATMAENHPSSWARRIAKEEFANAAVLHRCQIHQLEDRVVLDLELHRGGQLFDYGPRQFCGVLSEELKLVARDELGKPHVALPTPRLSDDKVKVAEARAAWKLAKKQSNEVIGGVCKRFETGLLAPPRWKHAEFVEQIVQHPVSGAVARRLIWGWFTDKRELLGTFRVTEEHEFVGLDDRPRAPAGPHVGLVHPALLNRDDREQWNAMLTDYAIVPPFPQLARPVYTLTTDEMNQTKFTRFKAKSLPQLKFLSRNDWQRFHTHFRRDYITLHTRAVVSLRGWGPIDVDGCSFHPIIISETRQQVVDELDAIPLKDVHPIVLCETLATLEAWKKLEQPA